MDTAIGTFQADNKAAFTPKRGEVMPIDVSSQERREIDEVMVEDFVQALNRDGRFLHPIVVREEGTSDYRLIAGHHRLEAWKRHSGKQAPIPAAIYPSHTPDALMTILEIEENLLRKELTPGERKAQTIRLAAALKKLDGEKLATELPVLGSDANSATKGGRGKKAATAKLAGKLGVSKAAVQKRIKEASAAIGEEIDLDRDTPQELERKAAELEKADKRQRAQPKVGRPKPRKLASRGVVDDDPMPHSGEIGSKIEALWTAFDALSRVHQFRFIHAACLHVGLDPLKMASPATFGLAHEEPELVSESPAEAALATDDAAVAQPEQQDDPAELGAEDLRVADHASEDADDAAADDADDGVLEAGDQPAEDLQDSDQDAYEGADQEPAAANLQEPDASPATDQGLGGATKCAYCGVQFSTIDPPEMKYGRLYHLDTCVKYAQPIAIAA